ncbi:hypothetical protein GR304_03530 [Microvirga sp. SYSU G3D207]|uniref:Lipoprotein n=2 Tax=Microvirga arsenatis TaxID=2692265 RepID=A0ABW9YRZ2_9HYPH|nr:hypothetical protein [Microvirga arsenatis]NBJ09980.1 hypothetical protein [Microvirga arsenatis]NBJ23048.1 hypothetical protein [Microvirga arsenatis]
MKGVSVARLCALGSVTVCAACATPAPQVMRSATVDQIVRQVKCEIAAGVAGSRSKDAPRRVKGWVAKSVLQLKTDRIASAGGSFGVTPLAPAPSLNLSFASGEGFTETSEITFVDDLDTMGRPRCPNGETEPEPYNNLGLAAWLQESLDAFEADNKTKFRQLGRTIIFTATDEGSGGVSFAVAPASLSLSAARKRSDTNTLVVALAEPPGETVYQVKIIGGTASDGTRTLSTGDPARGVPARPPFLRTSPIPQGTIENLNRMLDRQLQRLQ